MKLEMREGSLAQADWYYAELESQPSTGLLARFRRGAQRDSRVQGPVTMAQLQQLASSGRVDRHRTLIWRPQWNRWQPAGEIQTLFSHQSPPPLPVKMVERGRLFRLIDWAVYFTLSLVLSIPLAILSGLTRTARFVAFWIRSIFAGQSVDPGHETLDPGFAAYPPVGLGLMAQVDSQNFEQDRQLQRWGRFAMLSQLASCVTGVIAIVAMEAEPWTMFGIFWLANLVFWTIFMRVAWRSVPAKYHLTDDRTMLYWMWVPGLSTYGWMRLIPELGEATYRLSHPGVEPPKTPRQMAWIATMMCFVPVLNIVGGVILLAWLAGVRQDLRTIHSNEMPAWN